MSPIPIEKRAVKGVEVRVICDWDRSEIVTLLMNMYYDPSQGDGTAAIKVGAGKKMF